MRSTFGGLSFAGAPVYNAIVGLNGSGSLTFVAHPALTTTLQLGGRGKLSFPGNSELFDRVPVRVMALTSGISAATQRYTYQADIEPAGVNFARTGLLAGDSSHADLVKLNALQARVTPFQAFVAAASTTQPGYIVTNDEDTILTFAPGSGTNPRIDLVVVRVRDDPYDSSGSQAGTVEIVQGVPAVAPLVPVDPATSIALWQVLIPANATGAVGVDFSTARTDRRTWTTGTGGSLPVPSVIDRDAVSSPYAGMPVWRTDTRWREVYDGTAWRVKAPVAVPNAAALSWITSPYDGQTAVSYSDNDLLQYDGATSAWVSFVKAALPYGQSTWATFTPTLTQSAAVPKTTHGAHYTQTGRIVTVNVQLDVNTTGTAGQIVKFGLPVACALSAGAIGRGYIYDLSGNVFLVGTVVLDTTTSAKLITSGATAYLGASGSPFTAALALGDIVGYAVRYEAA